ncbi:hypothetical protein [Ferrovibrio sp.]|uniref:hypothetical protein n=1 Tax=Ferrovibrio sp. TaxID=1917215 RepID=UPI0035AFDF9D
MQIRVASGQAAELLSPEDFRRFSVLAERRDRKEPEAELAALGRRDGEHVWIDPERIGQMAGAARTAAWDAQFKGMIGFAAKHGWVDEAGHVRAHIEYSDSDD